MPLAMELFTTEVNPMVIVPAEDAVALNDLVTAMNSPPAAAQMSNLLSTWVPLIATLNTREPAELNMYSTKSSRTV